MIKDFLRVAGDAVTRPRDARGIVCMIFEKKHDYEYPNRGARL